MSGPPLEEHLAGNTLWPEGHKLYGHGNNLYAMAAHPSGRLLASACTVCGIACHTECEAAGSTTQRDLKLCCLMVVRVVTGCHGGYHMGMLFVRYSSSRSSWQSPFQIGQYMPVLLC